MVLHFEQGSSTTPLSDGVSLQVLYECWVGGGSLLPMSVLLSFIERLIISSSTVVLCLKAGWRWMKSGAECKTTAVLNPTAICSEGFDDEARLVFDVSED